MDSGALNGKINIYFHYISALIKFHRDIFLNYLV